jgi:O-antigen/teichoic acid export membrane protein
MSFIRSFSFTFGTKALSLVLLLVMRILMARLLGPAGFGSFGVALNLITILSRWGSVGIAPATQLIIGKHPDLKNSVFTCTLILSLILGLINFLLIHFFADELVTWQLGENPSAQNIFRQIYPFMPVIILS